MHAMLGTASDYRYSETVDDGNRAVLGMIRHAQARGRTCLPRYLGLDVNSYACLSDYLGRERVLSVIEADLVVEHRDVEDIRQLLLEMRREEWMDLYSLLVAHRRGQSVSELWMAKVVAAGCLGAKHLWQDLGLDNRQTLSDLLFVNFPELAANNTRNMRWKKYLYKQLCEREGAYVCRAPSCEQCAAFSECFGTED